MSDPPQGRGVGFRFRPTDWMYRCPGDTDAVPVWGEGRFVPFEEVRLSPAAAVLSYGCGVFEGLGAHRGGGGDGRIRLFRARASAERFARSAARLAMPPFPAGEFLRAVAGIAARQARLVPPPGEGFFYLRPMMHGIEPMLGLDRGHLFAVTVWGAPVGEYFAGREAVRLEVVPRGRAAPGGTGAAKAIGNYPGSVLLREGARERGFDDLLFLDAAGAGTVSETTGSNFFCLLEDGVLATPALDDTILAGITRDSVIRVAREILGLEVREGPLPIAEVLDRGREAFCTGTAWTVMPVAELSGGEDGGGARGAGGSRRFGEPTLAPRIRGILRGIQAGERPDPFGWTTEVSQGGEAAGEETP